MFFNPKTMEIKNVAIIAHVDHGKTTLVDAILKQTHTFRDNQKEMGETLIMDSNALEREKGITILAKNTSVFYKGVKINIIDTPGHADFGGEVERTINMASSAILLVDVAEGPLPQTKFVLKKALEAKLNIILILNKIDKKDARVEEVVREVENLFLELADYDSALNYSTIYAVGRDGKAFYTLPEKYTPDIEGSLEPLFETILAKVPNSNTKSDKPLQMLISTLDFDNYVGRLCIGKVTQGILNKEQTIALVDNNKILGTYKVQKLYTSEGIGRKEIETAECGDIVAIAGIPQLSIGMTITDPNHPVSLPTITVEDPTIKISLGPNTSPFAGKEGKFSTSRQLKERLLKEKETNLGLKITEDEGGANFIVSGRGELHLAILIETMRREGYEMQISKPEVIYKEIDGKEAEPYEEVTIDINKQYLGIITEEMGKRKAQMQDMNTTKDDNIRVVYKISSQNLLGLRNILVVSTRGTALINTYFLGYFPKGAKSENARNGALIAVVSGKSLSYGLENGQDRGTLFIGPGENVYEGMVVGIGTRIHDVEVNVCKGKKLTNVRSETADIIVPLTPPTKLTLEAALDFIADDELLEVTPQNIRVRKKYLSTVERRVHNRDK